jgi:predicted Zn-dependent protease
MTLTKITFQRYIVKLRACLIVMLAVSLGATVPARAAPSIIRDAEIENLLRDYLNPIFKAAGLKPRAVQMILINDSTLNAFVAGGQRIFIHTGLLIATKNPNQVIGVLAHEAAHIAGGHLSRLRRQLDKASTASIIGALLGVAAAAGAAASGSGNATQAGVGVLTGAQSIGRRSLLQYQRAQEAAADQAAFKYLDRAGQSPRGMIEMFQKLADSSLLSLRNVDPYSLTHPVPRSRMAYLEQNVGKSRFYNKKDSPKLMLRHQLMQAKIRGFGASPQSVFRRYPVSNTSLPARYARAISYYRNANLSQAMREIDGLIKLQPKYPYFWELKGQALFENGKAQRAIAPLQKAVSLAPNSGLIRIMLAQALLAENGKKNAQKAIRQLTIARRSEPNSSSLYRFLAVANSRLGRIGQADLASAESAFRIGDLNLAKERARKAKRSLKKGSPGWIRASDILDFKHRK